MPRKTVCPPTGTRRYGVRSNYTQGTLKEALERIKSGELSTYAAHQIYGIPRSTLKNKLEEKRGKTIGRPTALTAEEETTLCDHILALAELERELEGVPPENIYNFDETGYHDVLNRKKLLFRRKCKHPDIIRNTTKSCYTVVYCGNAAGEVLPPYFIFKAKQKWSDWLVGAPAGSRMSVTNTGWIDTETYDDWFEKHLLPQLKEKEERKILIGDNLSSHISLKVSRLCQENNVRLIMLVANSTHLLQPLDVAYFSPLKAAWRTVLTQWRTTSQGKIAVTLPKNKFAQLVKTSLDVIEPNS
nr:unnamed protein product [Callosobruchus analis]